MPVERKNAHMLPDRLTSNGFHVEGPTPSRYWGDQWLRVAEKVLKGLNHQFTNRVTSLEAIVGIFDPEYRSADLEGSMTAEVTRLHDLLNLYRSLTSEPTAVPEPVRHQDVIPLVVRLHEHHADLRHIPCAITGDAATEPVLVRYSALLRCILVLLESVAGNALRSGSVEPIAIWFGTEAEEVVLRIRGEAPRDQLMFSGEGSLLHAVRAALTHAHATAEGAVRRTNVRSEVEYEIRLPALTAVRRREQAAQRGDTT